MNVHRPEKRDRTMVVKTSIDSIGWRQEYREKLHHLVDLVNITTMHAYALSKYIFLHDFQANENLDATIFMNERFFAEVWLALIDYKRRAYGDETIRYRNLVDEYSTPYLLYTNYERPSFPYSQQCANYEGTKMVVAYTNNIQMRFSQHFRRAINALLNTRQRKVELEEQLVGQGLDATQISRRIRETIITPATTFQQIVAGRNVSRNEIPADPPYLREVFDAFDNDSIYYDAKVHPIQHIAAFYQLARLFEQLQLPAFACFPLHRSWSPSYIMIDAKSYGKTFSVADGPKKFLILADRMMSSMYIRKPAQNGALRFRGTLETDGVGVSIIKKRKDRDTHPRTGAVPKMEEETPYVGRLTVEKHREIAGRCVTVDPGRRNMLYCAHERSTSLDPVKFRYTKQKQDKVRKTKKHRRLIQRLKGQDQEVVRAELDLSGFQSNTLEIDDYYRFLIARADVFAILQHFYGSTGTIHNPDRFLMRKLRLSSSFNKHRADLKLIDGLKRKFGETAVFVMGNWSATHVRYHEPIRGKEFRVLLCRNGFEVFLIDEYKTSKCCPTCLNESL